ncbi:MAG: DUF3467 domain-containing protein [Deltaproteobacteria bacterium HGW-Deltaproteobacteria-4]|nr:MAG: DUF3467 domain-containing protein [Deltaproteobacteria bacterium HGW-Deltaproteobacteria-4]
MEKKEQKLEIQIDEATAQGIYANLGIINHTDSEFTIDFVYLQPQTPQGKVRARIITSPRHAKRLLLALEENVRRFEANFGAIEPGPAGNEGAIIQ